MQAATGWLWFSHWQFALQLEFLPKGEGKTKHKHNVREICKLAFCDFWSLKDLQLCNWILNRKVILRKCMSLAYVIIPLQFPEGTDVFLSQIPSLSLHWYIHVVFFFILTLMTLYTLLTLSFSCVSYVKRSKIWIRFSLIRTFRITSTIWTDRWVKSSLV